MFTRIGALCVALFLFLAAATQAEEVFVGSFAEPRDGGNLDISRSSFDGNTVLIVPRAHASEALNGSTRWRNVLFAVRGVAGRAPAFRLPLRSPVTGKTILAGDLVSYENVKLVWSYDPDSVQWNTFEHYARTGRTSAEWTVEAKNETAFTQDVVYVSINEHFPVAGFYEWIETEVLLHPLVRPTPSETTPGTFVIGYQSGAAASAACSRPVPDMPLFGFVIRDPLAQPKKLVMLVSGQHPYEGQNKVALQAAVDWILNSPSAEAQAYRATYVTLVYPFVNPTGELAGLWRGTAYQPTKDTNRNWHTSETIPSRNRGIDTVIVHKNALKKDIAALGLGEPLAAFDYHQNFGDYPGQLDYVLHSSPSALTTAPLARRVAGTDLAAYTTRLNGAAPMASKPSDPTTQETLRGYLIARGVALPLTFERSVYNNIASEWDFGVASVAALVDPATVVPLAEPPPPAVASAITFKGRTLKAKPTPAPAPPSQRVLPIVEHSEPPARVGQTAEG
ncbi:hypothetical protein [Opitutus terrae]|uniref:Peptidase M14 carboxypeptidase A domain-containing protein n=1 Tax=Opitutus terrae (strain DSM 11246 / JCM 15787 / PB90-1) TaxID=452637 RepID=B1ZT93_OPITP|nr:hypothetical protein [Opitutus terrae]ACB76547.1 hypothetical protein Oter_3268 [Opitutus terrae PB90-1]